MEENAVPAIETPLINMFFVAVAPATTIKADKIIVSTNNSSDSIPSHTLKELWKEQDKHYFEKVTAGWEILCRCQSYSNFSSTSPAAALQWPKLPPT